MIVRRDLRWDMVFYYTWKSLLYYLLLALLVYLLHHQFALLYLSVPFYTITAFSTALAIFLGFKNNNAYERWWEARKIWGLMVNYSRAWTRQVMNFIIEPGQEEHADVRALQHRMIYRHIAFVHALRVFLRKKHDYNYSGQQELFESKNEYKDTESFLDRKEYVLFCRKNNPPNYLLELQAEDMRKAYLDGWISDFRFVKLEETLVEFTNIQGRSERIKNTPLPRAYSYFSRVFVFIHATMLPFAFVEDLGLAMIPVSIVISFIFKALDQVGERTEDPFENRLDDTPLTALSITIETNMKEQWGEKDLPPKPEAVKGILF